MTLDEWRKLVCWLKPRQGVEVNVGELTALLDRMEAVEEWMYENAEGDGLRRVLCPPRSSMPPETKSEGPAATIAGSPRKPGRKI